MAAAYVVRRNVTGPDREQAQVLVFRRRHQQPGFSIHRAYLHEAKMGLSGPSGKRGNVTK